MTDEPGRVASPLTEGLGRATPARWCVKEAGSGLTVAQGTAPTPEIASAEAAHYAVQYAQDGPVTWWVRQGRKTVLQGKLAGVTMVMRPTKLKA